MAVMDLIAWRTTLDPAEDKYIEKLEWTEEYETKTVIGDK